MNAGNESNGVTAFTPVEAGRRIESIDVVRGFALLGILVVNSLFFSMPLAEALSTPREGVDGELDGIAWWIVSVLFQYKFISLFSMLFGVGAAIQFERARSANRSFNAFFSRRLLVLFFFGAIHALCLWYGDILALYAVIGLALLILCRLSTGVLVLVGLGLLTFAAIVGGGLGALAGLDPPPTLPTPEEAAALVPPDGWLQSMNAAQWSPMDGTWWAAERRAYAEGPYVDLFFFRMVSWIFSILMATFHIGWHIMAMFAFGVALYRSGFFGAEGDRIRRLAILGALPAGLLLEVSGAVITMRWSTELPVLQGLTTAIHEYGGFLMALGYAGIVTTLVRAGFLGGLGRLIASTGRMALTVYLAETLVMTSIFYHYGGALFGEVGRFWLLLIALGVWAVLAVFSASWLKAYRQGPVEWLWRTLSYGRTGRGG